MCKQLKNTIFSGSPVPVVLWIKARYFEFMIWDTALVRSLLDKHFRALKGISLFIAVIAIYKAKWAEILT